MRRRWVYRKGEDGQVHAVEVTAEREVEVRTQISMDRHYENLCATDGTDIGSRRKHREYMRVNGLAMADDYKETWAKAQKDRAEFFTTGTAAEHKELRETIERAAYEVERQRRGRK